MMRDLSNDYLIDPVTGCWVWQRGTTRSGYGAVWDGQKQCPAHRVFYEQYRGPIPEGLELDHLCRNRRCVNPARLEPVTPIENKRRGAGTKLTPESVAELHKLRHNPGMTYRALSARFGISLAQTWRIINGKRWTDKGVAA